MRKYHILLSALFLVWIYGFFLGHILLPDKSFSEMENRNLAAAPAFSAQRLFDGRFGSEFETYLNDQFPLRDFFKQFSTADQYAAGLREVGGVYFGAGGALLSHTQLENSQLAQTNLLAVQALAEEATVPVYTALVPDAACVWEEKLPVGAPALDQRAFIQNAYAEIGGGIDVVGNMDRHAAEDIYYRTDHHWTSLGAYYGYEAIALGMGLAPAPLESYTPATLSDDFYGTLYSKAPAFWLSPDEISAYVPGEAASVSSFDGIERREYPTLYVEENLQKKDKYTVFLGGNSPLVVLRTQNAEAPRLLVLRDSYADSLAPFFTAHFSEIHLLDVRYYRQSVLEYMQEYEIDSLLVVYSVDQFANVMNLSSVV